MLLAGLAISALAGALTTLALALAPSPFAFYDAYDWLMGSLIDRSLDQAAFAGLPGFAHHRACCSGSAPALDRLALGEEVAQSLGHDVAPAAAAGRLPHRLRGRRLRRDLRRDRLHRPDRADLRPAADRAAIPGRAILPAALIGALLLIAADLVGAARAARADAADRRRHRACSARPSSSGWSPICAGGCGP